MTVDQSAVREGQPSCGPGRSDRIRVVLPCAGGGAVGRQRHQWSAGPLHLEDVLGGPIASARSKCKAQHVVASSLRRYVLGNATPGSPIAVQLRGLVAGAGGQNAWRTVVDLDAAGDGPTCERAHIVEASGGNGRLLEVPVADQVVGCAGG